MLFRMVSDYREALDEGRGERVYGELLDSLDAYARGHFGFEDSCMVACRCPVAAANRADHARFLELLGVYRARFLATGFDRGEAQQLVDTLDNWLESHIGCLDVQLRGSSHAP